jgi:dTDP-4-dehydrorhamnose 3,5-epimerase
MIVRPLAIVGAFEVTPVLHDDARGRFHEFYRADRLGEAVGHPLRLAQGNVSVSARGVVRGLHYAAVPPGQAKYVHCVRGAILDVVADVRVGSPTFGRWEALRLDDEEARALYVAEGLAHGFCALTDDAVVAYLCSEAYAPAREHAVHALDPELAIAWPAARPALSARDAAAPTLAAARASGVLPDHAACLALYASLRSEPRQ